MLRLRPTTTTSSPRCSAKLNQALPRTPKMLFQCRANLLQRRRSRSARAGLGESPAVAAVDRAAPRLRIHRLRWRGPSLGLHPHRRDRHLQRRHCTRWKMPRPCTWTTSTQPPGSMPTSTYTVSMRTLLFLTRGSLEACRRRNFWRRQTPQTSINSQTPLGRSAWNPSRHHWTRSREWLSDILSRRLSSLPPCPSVEDRQRLSWLAWKKHEKSSKSALSRRRRTPKSGSSSDTSGATTATYLGHSTATGKLLPSLAADSTRKQQRARCS
mmetsp:Transcript_2476/g.7259  ORF Transcript_2476/g.7259 Transcript_2476/m.7259 type:complete len:269 (+) Transcript_2476:432-1238(+)